ncbi:MAG: hypothetical protein J6K17_14735 [Oscillospiraceae bacterium]|nr:hypothetical protein [Oscillospiraceae bacterium]
MQIKTINLTGTEQAVKFAETSTHFWVQNLGGSDVLVSMESGISEGKDNVLTVTSGGAGYVRSDMGDKTVYLLGNGKVQVYGVNNAFCPFKPGTKGGDAITFTGGAIAGTVDYPLLALNLYGQSIQNGTPTPEAPVDIVSVGDNGTVEITACGKNILMQTCVDKTEYGITFTKQPDGSIIMNGTSTSNFAYTIYDYNKSNTLVFNGGKYTISFGDEFNAWVRSSPTTAAMVVGCQIGESANYISYSKHGVRTFSTDEYVEERNLFVKVKLDAGAVCDNIRIYPQIEKGDTATEYEPYKGNTATITSGLPLCSVGDYRDELIYNADGTGKIIKRTGITTFDGSDNEEWELGSNYMRIGSPILSGVIAKTDEANPIANCICTNLPIVSANETFNGAQGLAVSSSGRVFICIASLAGNSDITAWTSYFAENPVTVVYQLETPQVIELSATEMAELGQLQTFDGMTTIYNDEGAEMTVKVATNPLLSEYVKPVIDGFTARYEERIAALEAAITST